MRTLPCLLTALLLSPGALGLQVEINNIHNGYKLVLECPSPSPAAAPSALLLPSLATLHNTLPPDEDITPILVPGPHGATLALHQLRQVAELGEEPEDLVLTNWARLPYYTVVFSRSEHEDEEAYARLYQHIRTSTLKPEQQQL